MPLQSTWKEEIPAIEEMMAEGISLEAIGLSYGVSKQRIYQVLTKYGVDTPNRKRKNFLRGKDPKHYWLDKMMRAKRVSGAQRLRVLNDLELPDVCPALGIKLNYDGNPGAKSGWTRTDNSPSVDRIDSNRGYEPDNIQIISWRANRIKNDSTPEELKLLAKFMEGKTT
jgi:hypothetical protein